MIHLISLGEMATLNHIQLLFRINELSLIIKHVLSIYVDYIVVRHFQITVEILGAVDGVGGLNCRIILQEVLAIIALLRVVCVYGPCHVVIL